MQILEQSKNLANRLLKTTGTVKQVESVCLMGPVVFHGLQQLCIEDEKHFLFHCSTVKEARILLNTRVCSKYGHCTNLNDIYFSLRQREDYHASLSDNRCSGVKKEMIAPSSFMVIYSQNWDLSHDIIMLVLLKRLCHHTKTTYCMCLFSEILTKTNPLLCAVLQQMCCDLSLLLYS